MKDSTIESINKDITKFIQNIALYEDDFAQESPGVWMGILASISTLSKVTVFLDNVRKKEMKADLDFYNQIREANGLSPTNVLPPWMLTLASIVHLGRFHSLFTALKKIPLPIVLRNILKKRLNVISSNHICTKVI